MNWGDMQTASFRGVPFLWKQLAGQPGHRVVVHEYPLRDDADIEQLGKKVLRGSIDAYIITAPYSGFVLGSDYLAARNRLFAALEQPGLGELVHPTLGRFTVQILDWPFDESTEMGGYCHIQISYVVAKQLAGLQVTVANDTATALQGSEASDQSETAFQQSWVRSALGKAGAAQAVVTQALRQVEGYLGTGQTTAAQINGLVNTPASLSALVSSLVLQVTSLTDLRQLFSSSYSSGSPNSGDVANDNSLTQLVQTQAVIGAAVLATESDYASYDEAIATRDELLDQLDRLALTAGDELFESIQSLRASLAAAIGDKAADLARVTRYTSQATLPALVLAHRLYGAENVAAAADDITTRNGIEHPGFVPGGVALEVLSDWSST